MDVDRDKLVKFLEEIVQRDMSSGIILLSTLDYISPEAQALVDILGPEAYKEAWDKARTDYPPGDISDILGAFATVGNTIQHEERKASLLKRVEERDTAFKMAEEICIYMKTGVNDEIFQAIRSICIKYLDSGHEYNGYQARTGVHWT